MIEIKLSKKEWKAIPLKKRKEMISSLSVLGIPLPKWMTASISPSVEAQKEDFYLPLPKIRNRNLPPAKEYNLRIITRCRLCKSTHYTDFCMKRTFLDHTILESLPFEGFPPDFLPDKEQLRYCNTCCSCKSRLAELPPSLIVSGLIKVSARSELPTTDAFAQNLRPTFRPTDFSIDAALTKS